MFGPDLPEPAAGRLTLYLLGPGFGESIVLALPSGAVVVVDACASNNVVLPCALLARLKKARVDLLVLTHPDLDHIAGVAELLACLDPHDVWTYPMSAAIRDVVALYARASQQTGFGQLANAIESLDAHQKRTGRVAEVNYGKTIRYGDVEIRALAPTHYDQGRASDAWRRLLRSKRGLRHRLDAILGGRKRLGDAPNALSLALSLTFRNHRVLLGGDVMRGASSRYSGWKGVLELLRGDDQRDGTDLECLVRDVSIVKVAHHGSKHSFEPALWDLHGKNEKPVALIAPFECGAVSLPDDETLDALKTRTRKLLVSVASQTVEERTRRAGFARSSAVRPLVQTTAPVVVVELLPDGSRAFHASSAALGLASDNA